MSKAVVRSRAKHARITIASALCGAAIAVPLGILPASAFAHSGAGRTPTAYLAIGDSLTFGYDEQNFYEHLPADEASNFDYGFVNVFAKHLARKEHGAGHQLETINLGCPGETTDGAIGHDPALGGGPGAEYDPCFYHNGEAARLGLGEYEFPLHVEYSSFGAESQMEAAVAALHTHDVTAASLYLGSNDELQTVSKCSSASYELEQGFHGLAECITVEVGENGHAFAGGVFHHIIANLATMIGDLRANGYGGEVLLIGFYNPQAELLPGSDTLQAKLNELLEFSNLAKTVEYAPGKFGPEVFGPGVRIANPFPTFNPREHRTEVRRICELTEECNAFDKKVNLEGQVKHPVTEQEAAKYPSGDIHPTRLGYHKLGILAYKVFEGQ